MKTLFNIQNVFLQRMNVILTMEDVSTCVQTLYLLMNAAAHKDTS